MTEAVLMMDNTDDNVQLLISMGFPDAAEVKRALVLAKNDVNEALSYLTNEIPGLYDVDMSEPSTSGVVENQSGDLEFPTTHLYELESRVFTSNWSIPYKKEESLGKCLTAAIALTKEGLMESDENCRRFIDSCLPACFDKLLNSYMVQKWGHDVHDGIQNMMKLFIDLAAIRLESPSLPLPYRILETLGSVFDPRCEYHQKNRHRSWDKAKYESEFAVGKTFAVPPQSLSYSSNYGFLVNLVNRFALAQGFHHIAVKHADIEQNLNCQDIHVLLYPCALVAEFFNPPVARPVFEPVIEAVNNYVNGVTDVQLKKPSSSAIVDCLCSLKLLTVALWPDSSTVDYDQLRLNVIHRLLKSSHFGCRINALKEISKLLEQSSSNKFEQLVIPSTTLSRWLTDNQILSLALEGSIDQSQYCEKLRTLLEFLGPRLTCADIGKIWQLQKNRNSVAVDNINTMIAQAAVRFHDKELNYLTALIEKSWRSEPLRGKLRLLILIGSIGRDTSKQFTYSKMLELLWRFAHEPGASPQLIDAALNEHLKIVCVTGRETERNEYIMKCVNDIEKRQWILPALYLIDAILKRVPKSSSYTTYNKSYFKVLTSSTTDIVKLLCDCLLEQHKFATLQFAESQSCNSALRVFPSSPLSIDVSRDSFICDTETQLHADFLLSDGYTYGLYVKSILDFLKFSLLEGELYLKLSLAKQVWGTLAEDGSSYEKEMGLEWFILITTDLEDTGKNAIFNDKILQMDPVGLTATGFRCFKKYFEEVNLSSRNMKKGFGSSLLVENMQLMGYDFIWQIVIGCPDSALGDEAIELLLDVSWRNLSDRLKRDSEVLHKKFLSECYRRLEVAAACLNIDGSVVALLIANATEVLTAPCVPGASTMPPPARAATFLSIERLLLVALKYIRVVDEMLTDGNRSVTPHQSCFYGQVFRLSLRVEITSSHAELNFLTHTNEQLATLRERLAERLKIETRALCIELDGVELKRSSDQLVLLELGINSASKLLVKSRFTLPFLTSNDASQQAGSGSGVQRSSSTTSLSKTLGLERERTLPTVMMANDPEVFDMLYSLANVNESAVVRGVRRLLLAIPSDRSVDAALESVATSSGVSSKSNSLERLKKGTGIISFDKATPKSSSASPKLKTKRQQACGSGPGAFNSEEKGSVPKWKYLFEVSAPLKMTAFRLLYNMEILHCKLVPTMFDSATLLTSQNFCSSFLASGGFSVLLNILHPDFLAPTTDPHLRLDIYTRLLEILSFLLVNRSPLAEIVRDECASLNASDSAEEISDSDDKLSVANAAASASACSSTLMSDVQRNVPQCFGISTLPESDLVCLLERLQRLVWAASSGSLSMVNADLLSPPYCTSSSRNRGSESSVGSSAGSDLDLQNSLHANIWQHYNRLSEGDVDVAVSAFRLMVDCLVSRPSDIALFFRLPHITEFVIDCLLVTESPVIRRAAFENLYRLIDISTLLEVGCDQLQSTTDPSGHTPQHQNLLRMVLRSQNSSSPMSHRTAASMSPMDTSSGAIPSGCSVRLYLFNLLLRMPLPLWPSSSSLRGSNYRLLSQCEEYFALRGRLVETLWIEDFDRLSPSLGDMLKNEVRWLLSFSCSTQSELLISDNAALSAHLNFLRVLIKVQPSVKVVIGEELIHRLLNDFLFPSSCLIMDGLNIGDTEGGSHVLHPKCRTAEARNAIFQLLLELCDNCYPNFQRVSERLIQLHHTYSPELANEWEFEPLVEERIQEGFVGLLNLGSTCYMNSVLQQFYMEPSLRSTILAMDVDEFDDNSMFVHLQALFARLQESQQKFISPCNFVSNFRFTGCSSPVNTREQQDAFEFYTNLVADIDDYLKKFNKNEVFRSKFEGVFSDQKICKECPHRYEREETFNALNLPVTAQNLDEVLSQFVKGEVLEGENAYYCEKCDAKRTTLKRLCIKTPPPVLTIHLKRFDFDYELNRSLKFNDYFEFPMEFDLFPFTTAGLSRLEADEDFFSYTAPTDGSGGGGSFLSPFPSSPISGSPISTTPLTKKLSSSALDNRRRFASLSAGIGCNSTEESRYKLCGVVVHSGQANAGHYYSFIKDRQQPQQDSIRKSSSNKNFGKWFRFNDTTVEPIELTPTFMQNEMFGGKYTTKTDKGTGFPEDRERYWNAYVLFYSLCQEKEPVRLIQPAASKSLSFRFSEVKSPLLSDSLMEVTEVIEAVEKRGIFNESIPLRIRQEIREENLRFARNRDVYSMEYCSFVRRFVQLFVERVDAVMDTKLIEFSVKYLLNSNWHTRKPADVQEWVRMINQLLLQSAASCNWLITFLAVFLTEMDYLLNFLLVCPNETIRSAFGSVVSGVISAHFHHGGTIKSPQFDLLIERLLSFLKHELLLKYYQNSHEYVELLFNYVLTQPEACGHLLDKQLFKLLISFMLTTTTSSAMPVAGDSSGPGNNQVDSSQETSNEKLQRRWSLNQSRDFGIVYKLLSLLILNCDISPYRRLTSEQSALSSGYTFVPLSVNVGSIKRLPIPSDIVRVVLGPLSQSFISELVWACCNIESAQDTLIDVCLYCSFANERFSQALLEEALLFCTKSYSNCLFRLLDELLCLQDDLQLYKVTWVLDGFKRGSVHINGILDTINSLHSIDSRRTYYCIKFLVTSKCSLLRECLTNELRLPRWQWAVEWLRKAMEEHSTSNNTSNNQNVLSNEESHTRNFQRTASAQATLEQANFLLSNDTSMDIAASPVTAARCFSPPGESSPSQKQGGDKLRENRSTFGASPRAVLSNGPTKRSRASTTTNDQKPVPKEHTIVEVGFDETATTTLHLTPPHA